MTPEEIRAMLLRGPQPPTEEERLLAAQRRMEFIKRSLAGETNATMYDPSIAKTPWQRTLEGMSAQYQEPAAYVDESTVELDSQIKRMLSTGAADSAEDTVPEASVVEADVAAKSDPASAQYRIDRLASVPSDAPVTYGPGESPEAKQQNVIAGLSVDPYSQEVVGDVDQGTGLPPGISLHDQIRAEAAMKGRLGSLSSPKDATPDSGDYKPASVDRGGAFSQSEMTPEIQQRLDDAMMYSAHADEEYAAWMLSTPEIRERMKWDPSAIGEQLRAISAQQQEDARKTLGMRLLEVGGDAAGKLSPQAASSYQMLMGEAPPQGMIGADPGDVAAEIYGLRSNLDYMISSARSYKQIAVMNEYKRKAIPIIRKAQGALSNGAPPDMVRQRLFAELSSIEGDLGMNSDMGGPPINQNPNQPPPPGQGMVGVQSIENY